MLKIRRAKNIINRPGCLKHYSQKRHTSFAVRPRYCRLPQPLWESLPVRGTELCSIDDERWLLLLFGEEGGTFPTFFPFFWGILGWTRTRRLVHFPGSNGGVEMILYSNLMSPPLQTLCRDGNQVSLKGRARKYEQPMISL